MTDYNITILDISDKELIELPDDIDKFTNLEKLDCYCNHLTSLNNLPNGQLAGHEDKPLGFPSTLKELNCSYLIITTI